MSDQHGQQEIFQQQQQQPNIQHLPHSVEPPKKIKTSRQKRSVSATPPALQPIPHLLPIHSAISERLNCFIRNKKIPNIIFHGSSGCGKHTILSGFLSTIYQGDQSAMKNYIMHVDCAYGRGIRFIREDLKFFAKTNVDLMDGERFKTIVLLNADKLTIDAQSALRRCIELFCHSTRFFIVVEDKNKLLKPILSRFCDVYIPEPATTLSPTLAPGTKNLHQYNLERVLGFESIKTARLAKLSALLLNSNSEQISATHNDNDNNNDTNNNNNNRRRCCYSNIMTLAEDLYERGYSALDIIALLESEPDPFSSHDTDANNDDGDAVGVDIGERDERALKKYELLIAFSRVKREFRNEKLLILFILYFMRFRSELDLKNITFI
jgi:hypothetical protein